MTALFKRLIQAIIVACALAGALIPAGAQQSPENSRQFSATFNIYDDNQLIGRPQMTVVEGQRATVQTKGSDGYLLRFVIVRLPSSADLSSKVAVQAEVFLGEGERWSLVASPTIEVPIGQIGSIELPGRYELGERDFKMTVLVKETSGNSAAMTQTPIDQCNSPMPFQLVVP